MVACLLSVVFLELYRLFCSSLCLMTQAQDSREDREAGMKPRKNLKTQTQLVLLINWV